jgi:hypothetical protein
VVVGAGEERLRLDFVHQLVKLVQVRREVIGDGFAFVGELKESGEVTEVTLDGLAGLVLVSCLARRAGIRDGPGQR